MILTVLANHGPMILGLLIVYFAKDKLANWLNGMTGAGKKIKSARIGGSRKQTSRRAAPRSGTRRTSRR